MSNAEKRFELLYQSEMVGLIGYAARRLANPPDAADVVAEVFTVAWRRIDEIPQGSEARLWLFGVARKVLANHRRGNTRRDGLLDRLRGELRLMSTHSRPIDSDVLDVRDALARLTPDDRELLMLTSWEGLAPGEIAIVMGLPPGTVRRRLHHARQQLRRELGIAESSLARSLADSERYDESGHVEVGEQALAEDCEEYQ